MAGSSIIKRENCGQSFTGLTDVGGSFSGMVYDRVFSRGGGVYPKEGRNDKSLNGGGAPIDTLKTLKDAFASKMRALN